jgi:hypothetical protein
MSEKSLESQNGIFRVRNILKTGSTVFAVSAILLIASPNMFLELLGLTASSEPLIWSMRMIGITLVALAGNMWMNSLQAEPQNLQKTAVLMSVGAMSLGLITLMIPVDLNWFSISYALIGFGFGAAYILALLLKRF